MKHKIGPFALSVLAILADQASKAFIVKNWPVPNTFIADVFGNGFLEIYHVRNTAIAFSLGNNFPDWIKPVLFVVLPLGVLVSLVVYYLKSDEFTTLQRWALAGILGGGLG
ncbi:MAG: signal peptidase II, partial [Spirochaetaceae bacterium]|nr:signal peptidase II [Spirochaetaceae bacterium]